jgi:hypothetical protein
MLMLKLGVQGLSVWDRDWDVCMGGVGFTVPWMTDDDERVGYGFDLSSWRWVLFRAAVWITQYG